MYLLNLIFCYIRTVVREILGVMKQLLQMTQTTGKEQNWTENIYAQMQ
jgi:hypothetical protein